MILTRADHARSSQGHRMDLIFHRIESVSQENIVRLNISMDYKPCIVLIIQKYVGWTVPAIPNSFGL